MSGALPIAISGWNPVNLDAVGGGAPAWRRSGEDLDVMPALGLADREAVRGVAGAARIWRKGGGEMGDSQAAGWIVGGESSQVSGRTFRNWTDIRVAIKFHE